MSPSPLGLFLLVAIFIQILPGLNLVTFLSAPLVYNVQNFISEETLLNTYTLIMCSLCFLMIFLYILHSVLKIDFDIQNIQISSFQCKALTFLSFIIIAAKLKSVGDIPILYALAGDTSKAAEIKGNILLGNAGAGGLAIGYLFLYIPLLSFLYSFIYKTKNNKSILFSVNLVMTVIYLTYDFQKGGLIALFLLVLLIMVRFGKAKQALLIPAIAVLCLITIYLILNSNNSSELDTMQLVNIALEQMLSRIFIGQIEGAYMMFATIKPSFAGYAFYGFPLAGTFGFSSPDPSAEVVRIFFPTASDAWVNTNSYNLAHAWSIFGLSAVIISPLMFVLNIALLDALRRIFSRYIGGVSQVLFIVVIIKLPFNNNFTDFLYFKPAIGYIIVSLALLLVSEKFLRLLKPPKVQFNYVQSVTQTHMKDENL